MLSPNSQRPKANNALLKQFVEFEIAEQETSRRHIEGDPDERPDRSGFRLRLDAELTAVISTTRGSKALGRSCAAYVLGPSSIFDYIHYEVEGHRKLLDIQEAYLKVRDNLRRDQCRETGQRHDQRASGTLSDGGAEGRLKRPAKVVRQLSTAVGLALLSGGRVCLSDAHLPQARARTAVPRPSTRAGLCEACLTLRKALRLRIQAIGVRPLLCSFCRAMKRAVSASLTRIQTSPNPSLGQRSAEDWSSCP